MNRGCQIPPNVSVGKYVLFGPEVAIVGADHGFDQPGVPMIYSGRPKVPPTVIEDEAYKGIGRCVHGLVADPGDGLKTVKPRPTGDQPLQQSPRTSGGRR